MPDAENIGYSIDRETPFAAVHCSDTARAEGKPAELVPTYSMRESDMGCGKSSKSRMRVHGAAATESRILQFSAMHTSALTTNSRRQRQLELVGNLQ